MKNKFLLSFGLILGNSCNLYSQDLDELNNQIIGLTNTLINLNTLLEVKKSPVQTEIDTWVNTVLNKVKEHYDNLLNPPEYVTKTAEARNLINAVESAINAAQAKNFFDKPEFTHYKNTLNTYLYRVVEYEANRKTDLAKTYKNKLKDLLIKLGPN